MPIRARSSSHSGANILRARSSRPRSISKRRSGAGRAASAPRAAAGEEGAWSDAEETDSLVQGGAAGLRERKKSNSRSGSEEGKARAAKEAAPAPGSASASASSGSSGSEGGAQRAAAPAPALAAAAPASSLAALHASYRDFFSTCFLPNIFSLAVVLLTFKAGFAAVDATTTFVLQERGVPKETLAFIDTVSFPLQLAIQVRAAARRCRLAGLARARGLPGALRGLRGLPDPLPRVRHHRRRRGRGPAR
jgi:hypothetical protein